MEIIVATNNNGKVIEIKDILNDYELKSLADINLDIDVLEDGSTFEENASKKAKEIALATNKICLADDSGLCVNALDGFPGVQTKRFLGPNISDDDRNAYIINKLNGLEKSKRIAKVVTCIAVSDGNKTICASGEIEGYIASSPHGSNGFGFDNIFELPNGKTLAELSSKEKNLLSSRKIACEKIREKLKDF